MKIIQDGNQIKYGSQIYAGKCVNCGCEFETKINVVQGNALTRYVPESGIDITKVSGPSIWCSCPQCEYKYILLRESETKAE